MSNWTLKEKSTGDLTVTIEGDEWTKAVEKAFNKIARNVTIDGFRKGKAPKALIEKRVPYEQRYIQAVDDHANEWMRKALDENDLKPITQPELDVKDVNDEKAVLVYTFAVTPEVTLGEYKGLKYEVEDATVTDAEVDQEIDRMRNSYAEMESTEDPAENGDTVNIDYEGFKDDVPFDGGKSENYDLKLGSGSFIPGFEDQLVGVKTGDEKEINLTFPEDYHAKDLAGAPVVFKVKVNDVKRQVLPELDDEFAQDLNIPEVEDVASLKENIRKRQEESKKNSAESKADNALIDQLADVVTADLPDVMVDQEVQGQIQQLSQYLQNLGIGLSQYLSMMGKTADDLKAEYHDAAVKNVKVRLGLEAIAKKENIELSDEDLEKEYNDLAEQYQMKAEDIKNYIDPEILKQDAANQKAFDFVKENAVHTTVTPAEEKTEPAEEPQE